MKVTFGGESNVFSNDVHTRLLDSIQRHVGIIDTGAGTYDQEYQKNQGTALEYDNVYFISSNGTGNGTYGSSAPLTQTELDTINTESPNSARIYIQGNSAYAINSATAGTPTHPSVNNNIGLYVYNGQDLYGRSTNYTTPATSSEQPNIQVDTMNGYSGFTTQGGENTFSDLNITGGTTVSEYGINTYDEEILNLHNMNISGFHSGVYAKNTGHGMLTMNVIHSTLKGNAHAGLQAYNDSDGMLTVNATRSTFNDNAYDGLQVINQLNGMLKVNATQSTFNNNSNNGMGLNNNGSGTLDVSVANSTLNDNGENGIGISNTAAGTINMNAENSAFNNNDGDGIYASNQSSGTVLMTATYSTFNNNGYYGIGINNSGVGTFNITDLNESDFDNNGYGGIYGLGNSAGSTTIDYTGASFSGTSQQDVGSNGYVTFVH